LLKKIAGSDWSDEVQGQVDDVVRQFAEDFGYDLDEEGHPLEAADDAPRRSREEATEDTEQQPEAEEETVPA
jgi:F-type H+-transporting ATPase subunit alpha